MNILIINIALRKESAVKIIPVGLGYIVTAIKRAGYSFDILDIDAYRFSDNEVENYVKKKKYDVICMGCLVTGYATIQSLSKMIREHHPHSTIIAGNSVATSIPEMLLRKTEVNIAVMGEGDITIVDLLDAIEKDRPLEEVKGICYIDNGRFIHTSIRPYIKDISSLPSIDYSLWDMDIYLASSQHAFKFPTPVPKEEIRAMPLNTARGCIGKCSFCYHVFKDLPYRYRNPYSTLREIKELIENYSINHIVFWDELSFFSKKQITEFTQKIKEEGIHFYWTGICRADLFNNDEDIEIILQMKETGCLSMGYSLESADSSILKSMNKKITLEGFRKQSELFQKAKIATGTSLVLGFPQETPDTIRKTIDCCIETRMYPSVGYLLPQPGSKVYEYAKENGYIGDEEQYISSMGDRQDLKINMTKMSDQLFETEVKSALLRCNEALNIGLREEELIKTGHRHHIKKDKALK
jgi:radical SAM superfamily enzyme YgiQ (UPF0313 family)